MFGHFTTLCMKGLKKKLLSVKTTQFKKVQTQINLPDLNAFISLYSTLIHQSESLEVPFLELRIPVFDQHWNDH